MLVRCRLYGDGGANGPWHIRLPNYRIVSIDYANGRAVVDIPTEDEPPERDDDTSTDYATIDGRRVLWRLNLARRLLWRFRLRQRYQEVADAIEPEPA